MWTKLYITSAIGIEIYLPPNIGHQKISLIASYRCNTNDLQPSYNIYITLTGGRPQQYNLTNSYTKTTSCTWIWHHTLQYMECLKQGSILHVSYSICGFCTLYFLVYPNGLLYHSDLLSEQLFLTGEYILYILKKDHWFYQAVLQYLYSLISQNSWTTCTSVQKIHKLAHKYHFSYGYLLYIVSGRCKQFIPLDCCITVGLFSDLFWQVVPQWISYSIRHAFILIIEGELHKLAYK